MNKPSSKQPARRARTRGAFGALRCAVGAVIGALSMVTLLLLPVASDAAVVSHYRQVRVKQVMSYPEFGGGDVIFSFDDPLPGCEGGIWVRASDPGFKQTVALLMMSQARNTPIRVWAHDNQIWTGSGARYCRLDTLSSEQ